MDNDRHAPATKGDLDDLRNELKQEIGGVRSEILDFKVEVNTRFQEFEHRMEQLFSDMEARVVATMYRLGEAGQQRLTAAEREAAALKDRMATLEDRLLQVEKRLDTPPKTQ